MRVLIMTFGTRGDIQPYAALAGRLAAAGHEAHLAVPEGFEDLLAPEVIVHPAGSEMLRLVQEVLPELSGARDAPKTFRTIKTAMRGHVQETWAAAREAQPDLIVFHPKCLAGPHIAELLGVPAVLSLPLPFYTPTGAHPVPFLGRASFGRAGNRASYRLIRLATAAYGGMLSDFRAQVGLPGRARRLADPLRAHDGSPVHTLYPYSRHVVPVPSDYPATAHVTGYWFLEEPAWEPPAELQEFLDAGEPPVYLGFGSMGFGQGADERRETILQALERCSLRGIVATGWGGIAGGASPSRDVLVIDGAPHDWLFPRMRAVVHHGGAGSTAAGLRAGRPTLVVPFLGDQPFWGGRVQDIGAGPAPIPPRALERRLADGLDELTGTPLFARRAEAVGAELRAEDGPGVAVDVLERIAAGAAGAA
ncbi:glycosyltransferase [Brachybacterium sp. YJGR34]|uniref:glycosyltransferase n=1 Tax=Brachybacterium sp. YJGR34 TaxID=2059911 RepID=UPI000E0BB42C|nr:glycosyltransferase [Brachybacterium sp. YJGR34]